MADQIKVAVHMHDDGTVTVYDASGVLRLAGPPFEPTLETVAERLARPLPAAGTVRAVRRRDALVASRPVRPWHRR